MSMISTYYIDPIFDGVIMYKYKEEYQKLKAECYRYERSLMEPFFKEKIEELYGKKK